ncbi:PAS domain-containing sensor histidine kinase [Minwuia sp.]|uniref:PAS domain-containing sensor histidine kinase n=1 Tax=Minwuia sp. TaxID=2493630 RepID=UPI003A949CDF
MSASRKAGKGTIRDFVAFDPSDLSPAEQEQRFLDFAEAASEWFWEMDEHLRFCWFSDRFEEIAGVPPHYLLGKSRRDLLEANDPVTDDIISAEDWWNHVADLEAHRPFKSFIHPRVHPDGRKVYLSISGKPVYTADGNFAGYRGIGADITDRMAIEQSLREAKQEAEAANRAKSEFLATMSHELRTPLNAIIGFSDMIAQEMNGPVGVACYRDYASDIHGSGERLLAVINDVLDMARMEAELMPVSQVWVATGDLLQDAQKKLSALADQNGIAVEVISEGVSTEVFVDRRRICQALCNILSNAVKFTQPGGAVTLSAACTASGGIELRVSDTGHGMTAEEIGKAMQPFTQISHHRTRQQEGTGLGLPLTDRLCHLHGGEMTITSSPGKGTQVGILLPPDRVRRLAATG